MFATGHTLITLLYGSRYKLELKLQLLWSWCGCKARPGALANIEVMNACKPKFGTRGKHTETQFRLAVSVGQEGPAGTKRV